MKRFLKDRYERISKRPFSYIPAEGIDQPEGHPERILGSPEKIIGNILF
jgi:hypothetical protein